MSNAGVQKWEPAPVSGRRVESDHNAMSGAGPGPLLVGVQRTMAKNSDFFLKSGGERPIYRLGGNYCHKGRKKIKVLLKDAVN